MYVKTSATTNLINRKIRNSVQCEVYQCIAAEYLQGDCRRSPSVSTMGGGHYTSTGGMALVKSWLLKFELHRHSAICFAILSYVPLAMC